MKKPEQLQTLMKLSSLVTSTLDPGTIRNRAIQAAMKITNARAGSLLLVDQESGGLFFEVALGDKGDMIKRARLKKGEGIAGWVAEKGKAVVIHDVQKDKRFYRGSDIKSQFLTKNMICVPVRSKNRIFGVLEAINKKKGAFTNDDRDMLSALANQVAIAIENANLYQELKEAFYGTAEALADTIEKRDPYTGGHTRRVMNYCMLIGESIGLTYNELEDLRLAAILHDVGKIGICDKILLKKERLSTEEMENMCLHPRYGAEILAHIRQLKHVIPGVRSHHERIDGKGYPDNLQNDSIPVIARIIAVADTFDAMTTDRPYREAMSVENALGELSKNAGLQFDTEIVAAFIKLCREGRLQA